MWMLLFKISKLGYSSKALSTQYECADNEINNFVSAECIKTYCPLECSSIEYESENSVGSFYSEPYLSSFQSYILPTKLTVSYSTLRYTQITESPQATFISLLAQLGGSLGMFISFSVFTLFESIELLVLILYAMVKPAKKCQVDSIRQNGLIFKIYLITKYHFN